MIISHLLPGPLVWKRVIGNGRWTAAMPADPGLVFGMVLEGEVWINSGERAELKRGDYILLVSPGAWCPSTGRPVRPIPLPSLDSRGGNIRIAGREGPGGALRIMAGHFEADPTSAPLLRRLLPPVMIVRAGGPSGSRLATLLQMIDDESIVGEAASNAVICRLLEIMLLEALRAGPSQSTAPAGISAALTDPRVSKAGRALHAELKRPWTLDQLATIAGMSRSRIASRSAPDSHRSPTSPHGA